MTPLVYRTVALATTFALCACATNVSNTPVTDNNAYSSGSTMPSADDHGTVQRSAASTNPTPTTSAIAQAPRSTGLLGSSYSRGKTPPDPLTGDWRVSLRVPGVESRKMDFFAVHRGESASVIVAKRGPKVTRQIYQYTISDEMVLPRHDSAVVEASCSISAGSTHTIFALVDTQAMGIVWAAKVDQFDLIKTVDPSKAKQLNCLVDENGRRKKYKLGWSGSLSR